MPQFVLDTDGQVASDAAPFDPTARLSWDDLDAFTQGYIECIFFTEGSPAFMAHEWESDECKEAQEQGTADGTIPGDVGFASLSPRALASCIKDCADFQRENAALLAQAYGHGFPARVIGDGTLPDSHRPAWEYDEAAAGRDFLYTRNGHGVGFWDRDLGKVGDDLADKCGHGTPFSTVNAYYENGQVGLE